MARDGGSGRGLGARLRYAFDRTISAGPLLLIGWLAILSLAFILVAGAVVTLLGIAPEGAGPLAFGDAVWASLMRTLDAGTMGADAGWAFRAVMLVVTLGGIFVVATLIGIVSSGIAGRRAELRKGRSMVVEADHILILNWSAAIFDIVTELTLAKASRRRTRIVILADRDMSAMQDEIARRVPGLRNTRFVCRTGDPADPVELAIASPQTSRAIIVLSPEAADPDSRVIKTVLALVSDPRRRTEPYRIAAEIRDARNAELLQMVGGSEAQPVRADDLVARIMVHSSRQPGLSAVYSELLDPGGNKLCTLEQKAIEGSSFGDAMAAYDTSTLIGVTDPQGKVWLNPPMETIIRPGMKAILIAGDPGAIEVTATPHNVDHTAIALHRRPEPAAERTLMLGWNHRGPAIAFELSRTVAPGSLLTIAADAPQLQADVGALMISGSNLQVEYGIVDVSSRAALEGLDIPTYDHVLVLGSSSDEGPQATDTRTLVTLLHLRRIAEAAGTPITIVSEMIDLHNRELAEVTRAGDFVVGNTLVSRMLARASENDNLGAIFGDLLDEQGSTIALREAGTYLELGQPMTFYTVTEACRRRGEVAIGHIRRRALPETEGRRLGGVVLNPRKSETLTYEAGDRIIVLARG
jgi:voltage-gated potassium channel Kch